MSTQTRLDAYKKAELEILEAQEMRGNDRAYRMADLTEVRQAIRDLETQAVREASSSGLRFSVGNFNR